MSMTMFVLEIIIIIMIIIIVIMISIFYLEQCWKRKEKKISHFKSNACSFALTLKKHHN